jgi:metal-responsive CopG/Arc/MetJ family transcriptional regulator
VKTAISLPDDLFQLAEVEAKALRVSRSELYSRAITEFLERRRSENVTERLNKVYGAAPAKLDPAFHRAQLMSIDKDSW